MKKTKYGVYAILKGKNDNTACPKNLFIAKDTMNATVYFKGYIWGEKDYYDYRLYKVGNIDNTLKITPCKVFIAGGYETNNELKEEKKSILQTKLLYDEVKNKLENNVSAALEVLFEGRVINE